MYYFGYVVEVDAGNGVFIPYSVRENASFGARSLIVKLINPDGTLADRQEVLLLGDADLRELTHTSIDEYMKSLTLEKAVLRMFSGL
jgi:hypothetical protein